MTIARFSRRIHVVDALRGFALTGILLLHAAQHFDLFVFPAGGANWLRTSDLFLSKAVFFVFEGKAYSIFAFLFGFSFFIQISNNAERGVDFRWRFLWRLVLLLAIGWLHALCYIGDILTLLALYGIPLVLLYRAPRALLLTIAALLLMQLPTLFRIATGFDDGGAAEQDYWRQWEQAFDVMAKGSFLDVLRFNAWQGHRVTWLFMVETGRYLQLFGLMLLGLLVGRSGYFRDVRAHSRATRAVLVRCLAVFITFDALHHLLPHLMPASARLEQLEFLLKSFADLALAAVLATGFILLYTRLKDPAKPSALAAYGKMSLTNYVSQGVVGALFFYGYGFSMYSMLGASGSLLFGLVFCAAQIAFSLWWLARFQYGPLEWLWRCLTLLSFSTPLRRAV